MADVYDKEKRSAVMRSVKSKGNKSTEIALINVFREYGIIGWRRQYPVKGRPDFVFLDKKVAIFVDGCFWHGHNCRNIHPQKNKEYWSNKISNNTKRDITVTQMFISRGWEVVRIWECELKKKNRSILLAKLKRFLKIQDVFN